MAERHDDRGSRVRPGAVVLVASPADLAPRRSTGATRGPRGHPRGAEWDAAPAHRWCHLRVTIHTTKTRVADGVSEQPLALRW